MKTLFFLQKSTIILLVILLSFFSASNLLALEQCEDNTNNIVIDLRPTDFEYVLMSQYAYNQYNKDYEEDDRSLFIVEDDLGAPTIYDLAEDEGLIDMSIFEIESGFSDRLKNWGLFKVKKGSLDYQGVVFVNHETKQIVIAHRGIVWSKPKTIRENFEGVVKGRPSPQMKEVFEFIKEVIEYAKERDYNLSFTGHSSGGFLAEISVYFCHRNDKHHYPQASAITFDSPGSEEILEKLQPNIREHAISLEKLDIRGYVTNPDIINTFNHHVGSLYAIEVGLDDYDFQTMDLTKYTRESHSLDNIIKHFEKKYFKSAEKIEPLAKYVYDFPISNLSGVKKYKSVVENTIKSFENLLKVAVGVSSVKGLENILDFAVGVSSVITSGSSLALTVYSIYSDILAIKNINRQKSTYFKHAEWDENCSCYRIPVEDGSEKFDLIYKGKYQLKDEYSSMLSMPLKHFGEGMQNFLQNFYDTFGNSNDNVSRQGFIEDLEKISKKAAYYLKNFALIDEEGLPLIVSLNENSPFDIHEFRSELSKCLSKKQTKIQNLAPTLFSNARAALHTFWKEIYENCKKTEPIETDEPTSDAVVIHSITNINMFATRKELLYVLEEARSKGENHIIQWLLEHEQIKKKIGKNRAIFWKEYLRASFDSEDLQELSESKYLTSLDLSGYKLVDDNGLRHVIKLINLRLLDLSGCGGITESGLKRLFKSNISRERGLADLENLLWLNLSGSSAVTNEVLEIIKDKLIDLESLNLSNCPEIDDEGLDYISDLGIRGLKELFLQNCDKITSNAWLRYISNLKDLMVLDVSGCSGITGDVLKKIAKKLPGLRRLYLSYCDNIDYYMIQELRDNKDLNVIVDDESEKIEKLYDRKLLDDAKSKFKDYENASERQEKILCLIDSKELCDRAVKEFEALVNIAAISTDLKETVEKDIAEAKELIVKTLDAHIRLLWRSEGLEKHLNKILADLTAASRRGILVKEKLALFDEVEKLYQKWIDKGLGEKLKDARISYFNKHGIDVPSDERRKAFDEVNRISEEWKEKTEEFERELLKMMKKTTAIPAINRLGKNTIEDGIGMCSP